MNIKKAINCHETSHSSPIGINFQITPHRQIFIPYAWLLSLELLQSTEIIFSFSSAKIRVTGENLLSIYQAATKAHLSKIWPEKWTPDTKTEWVQRIVLEAPQTEGLQTPFPSES